MLYIEDDLIGASEKVSKSWELFSQLVMDIQSYQRSDACKLMSETRYQFDNRYMVVTELISSKVLLKIADLAHALRSAMDHIAYAFWRADSRPNNKVKSYRDVSFPTVESRSEFQKRIGHLGLSADISDYLVSLEGYRDGQGDWLYKLSAIDNAGKHRELPSVDCVYTVSGIKVYRKNYEDYNNPFIENVPPKSLTISSNAIRRYYAYPGGMAHGGDSIVDTQQNMDLTTDSSESQIVIDVLFNRPFANHVPVLDVLSQWMHESNTVINNVIEIARARTSVSY